MVIFFSSVKSVYLNQFFCLLCIQAVSDVGPYQTIYWKNALCRCWTSRVCAWTRYETAEVVWEWLFSVCCAHWPTSFCEKKGGVHFFTLKFGRHNRYEKLLLCNSASGDIAWCNKNNSKWGFYFWIRTKTCFFSKKIQNNPD